MNEREQMLTSILDCKRIDLYTDRVRLDKRQQSQFEDMQRRREKGEPLQHILGSCDFMGLKLKVNEHVLIPRPETEILVDYALKRLQAYPRSKSLSVLDLGTGSGNIAISIAKNVYRCEVTAVDVSSGAVETAKQNAYEHAVHKNIEFVHQDLNAFLCNKALAGKKYDLIISNPPYIKSRDIKDLPEDVRREPVLALDGGEDGLEYFRKIASLSRNLFLDDGTILFEIGDGQHSEVKKLLTQYSEYKDVVFIKDYTNTERIVSAKYSRKF